jgi:uncharacterized membrane protein YtjA (UPF0391 family)
MLKLAPIFLIATIVLGVYSLSATAVLPKILLFSSSMLLFLSLLGKKRMA